MSLAPEQRERIQIHVDAGDRETEPVFVGREDLFDAANRNIASAALGRTKGRTLCLSGPPGIGKTAFVTECAKRLRESKSRAIAFSVAPDQLRNPVSILRSLHAALVPLEAWFPDLARSAGQFLSALRLEEIGILGLKVKFDRTAEQRGLPAEDRAFPWNAVGAMIGGMDAGSVPVLVPMVDEAHGLDGSDGRAGARNKVLQDLHMGGPLPVVPILAGHVQTPDILAASISGRYATGNESPMQCLSETESLEYAEWMLNFYEARGNRTQVARWIASECGGFPHHLRNAVAAIGGRCWMRTPANCRSWMRQPSALDCPNAFPGHERPASVTAGAEVRNIRAADESDGAVQSAIGGAGIDPRDLHSSPAQMALELGRFPAGPADPHGLKPGSGGLSGSL